MNDATFLLAFHSNYGPIVLSFRNIITGRTADDTSLTDDGKHCISDR